MDELPFDKKKQAREGRQPSLCDRTGQVKRSCKCASCRGRRNRNQGKTKQRAARKQLERSGLVNRERWVGRTAHEENWRGMVRVEVKSGARDAGPILTRYENARGQSDAQTAIGDNRPFVFVAMPPGASYGLAVLKLEDLEQLLAAYGQYATQYATGGRLAER